MNRPLPRPETSSSIPFPFISFADPSSLTPMDSYRFKNRGGPRVRQPLPSRFGTALSGARQADPAYGRKLFSRLLFQKGRAQSAARKAARSANGARQRTRGLLAASSGTSGDFNRLLPRCSVGRPRHPLRGVTERLQPVSVARANAVFPVQALVRQLHLDRPPAAVRIWLRVITQRIEMRQVVADRSESILLVSPRPRKVSFASGSGGHALKNGRRYRLELRLAGADHIDRRARRLRQFRNIFRRNHARVVGAVGKNHNDLSSLDPRRILYCQKQAVVQRRVVAGHRRTHAAQNRGTVRGQLRGPRKVPAVGIERNLVGALQRANEFRNGVLREYKAAVHVIAGVEQHEHIRARHQRAQIARRNALAGVAALPAASRRISAL